MSTVQVYGNVWDGANSPVPASRHPEFWFRPEAHAVGTSALLLGVEVKANLTDTGSFTVQLDPDMYYRPVLRWLTSPAEQAPEMWSWQYAEWDFLVVPGTGGLITDLADNYPPGSVVIALGPPPNPMPPVLWIDISDVDADGHPQPYYPGGN
ncbi:hypothetical protein J2Y69_002294 [Microbacterium resistens]|uniref:Uncharacterized protein n=1 Tax=Microbacterium resistens TaxID=156977 RepID=A0ABU1SDL4_9MICO|nr:hypothetical protein [Microbacterium resistens]MDR6867690.1 hypothetical protein [Microbacterium resistens]